MNTMTRFHMADSDTVQWMPCIGALSVYGASSATIYFKSDQAATTRDALAAFVEPVSPADGNASVHGRSDTAAYMYPSPDCHIFANERDGKVTLFFSRIGEPNGGFNILMSEASAARVLGVLASASYFTVHSEPSPAVIAIPRRWLRRLVPA